MKRFALFYLLLFPSLHGESLLVSTFHPAPDDSWKISIVGAYQVGDEIWITSDVEKTTAFGLGIVNYPFDIIKVDLPTIVATHKGDLSIINADGMLYFQRSQVSEFDYELGDGWVYTEVVGWIYIRNYPWLFSPHLDWIFVREAGIPATSLTPSKPLKLTYWLYTQQYGWLWKSPNRDDYYQPESDSYIEP